MADSIPCLYCGWTETYHLHGLTGKVERADKIYPEKSKSLNQCRNESPGYTPEDPELARKLAAKAAADKAEQAKRARPFGGYVSSDYQF